MSVESKARAIAECAHPMAIGLPGSAALRCPHCGGMRLDHGGPWALPHLVAELVRELDAPPPLTTAEKVVSALFPDQEEKPRP